MLPPLKSVLVRLSGHDVVTWRQDAITFDQKAGLNNLKPTGARPNGRRRDFLILVGIVDGFFAALALTGFMKGNAVLLGGSLIGMGLFTVTLAWVMWGVMSRY